MKQVRDDDVQTVRFLADWRVMTLQQLAWATGRHLDSVRKRLLTQIAAGLVQRLPGVIDGAVGRPVALFAATTAAVPWLRDHGCELPVRFEVPAAATIRHTLVVNDVLAQLPRLTRALPEFQCRWAIPVRPGNRSARRHVGNPALCVKGQAGDAASRWWVPDAVFTIHHTGLGRTLLLYLEADCGTEPLVSPAADPSAVQEKLRGYREHYCRKTYQALAAAWQLELNGFRLLVVTTGQQRLANLGRLVQQTEGCGFVWLTTQQELARRGLHERIWLQEGKEPTESILGTQYARAVTALTPPEASLDSAP